MAGFMCDIVTPVAKLVSDEVELVVVPGVEGEMGFLKGHAPLVSVLADGEARVKAVGASETPKRRLARRRSQPIRRGATFS